MAGYLTLRPERVKPPFTWALLEEAVRYFQEHDRPLLPYARPAEEYSTVWLVGPGFELEKYSKGKDPWDEVLDSALAARKTAESILTGRSKRSDVPMDNEGLVEIILEAAAEDFNSFEDVMEIFDPAKFTAGEGRGPVVTWDTFDDQPFERQLEIIIGFYTQFPERLLAPDRDHTELFGPEDFGSDDPRYAVFEVLDELPQDVLPIGSFSCWDSAGIWGDAIEVEVDCELALTLLQVLLDDRDANIRITVDPP